MVIGRAGAYPITARPWRSLRWLILAPHPDDETLGAGALIAQTTAAGNLAGLVYLTDGSASHPPVEGRTGCLIAARAREARQAWRRLAGKRTDTPFFLGWKDAAPEIAGSATFSRSCRKLAALCLRLRVDALATTASHEPHCDHAAAAGLANAVKAMSHGRIIVAEYRVWGVAPVARTHAALITAPMLPGVRRHCLAAHRSQLSTSHGAGFRLPRDKRAMAPHDILYIRKRA